MNRFLQVFCILAFAATPIASRAQQLFFDDFEGGTMSKAENGVKWGSSAYTSIISGFGKSGSKSLRFQFLAGDNSWAEQRFNLGKDYTDITIEYYAYYPDGSDGRGVKFVHKSNPSMGDNNKFFRLWKGNTADGGEGYTQFYVKVGASTDLSSGTTGDESIYAEYGTNAQGVGQGGSCGCAEGGGTDNFITDAYRGRWVPFKIRVKTATSANNNGLMEVWRDGVLAFRASKMAIYPTGGVGNAFNVGYLLGWANSGFSQTTYVYVDDVKISAGATSSTVPSPPAAVSVN